MSQEPEEGVEEVGLGCFCEMGFYLGELSWVKHHCLICCSLLLHILLFFFTINFWVKVSVSYLFI